MHELDASGLLCPLPLLQTKKLITTLRPGEQVHIICTDPASELDFKAYVAVTGHKLLRLEQHGTQWHFWLEKV
jgi:tRNA 2-thiouridine synthesizing protein A